MNHSSSRWSQLRRWLRGTWLSRLPLVGTLLSTKPSTTAKKVRKSVPLEISELETRFVCNDLVSMGVSALAGSIALEMAATYRTPTQVLMNGWGTVGASVPEKDSPQQSATPSSLLLNDEASNSYFLSLSAIPPSKAEEEKATPAPQQSEQVPEQEPQDQQLVSAQTALADPVFDSEFMDRISAALDNPIADGDGQEKGGGGSSSGFGSNPFETAGISGDGGAPSADLMDRSGGSSSGGGGLDSPSDDSDFARFMTNGFPAFSTNAVPPESGEPAARRVARNILGQEEPASTTPPTPALDPEFGTTPLAFEVNRGQAGEGTQFFARGTGYNISLNSSEAVLLLQRPPSDNAGAEQPGTDELRVRLVGARDDVELAGRDRLNTHVNYYGAGFDSSGITDVPTFSTVVAQDVLPGVDIVYQGDQHNLRFDLHVQAGTDLSRVSLEYAGTEAVFLDESGRLVLRTEGGDLVQSAPVFYQVIDGVRADVEGRYVANEEGLVGFQVDAYDRTQELVIDPTLSYLTYFGSGFDEVRSDVAVDDDGSIVSANITEIFSFTGLTFQKFTPDGSGIAYVTVLIGGVDDAQVAVDGAGNAHLAGSVSGFYFFATGGVYQTSIDGGTDAFVAKFDPTGRIVWSSLLGGSGDERVSGLAVDASGRVIVTGWTDSNDFDTEAPDQGSLAGGVDGFVTVFEEDGAALDWSTYLGGATSGVAEDDRVTGVAVDGQGRILVAGVTTTSDFDTTPGAYDDTLDGDQDAFVVRYDGDGSKQYATYLGGSGLDEARGIAADTQGHAYVAGYTESSDLVATAGAYSDTYGGSGDGFVTKMSLDGDGVDWSSFLGDSGYDEANAIAVDYNGNAYVTGGTDSSAWSGSSTTLLDAFTVALNDFDGSAGWVEFLTGNDDDRGTSLVVDFDQNVILAGETRSTDLPVQSPYDASPNGGIDAFLARYDSLKPPILTAITDDTGASGTDFVTSDDTLLLEGTAQPGVDVNIFRADIGYIDTVTADGSGNWSYDYTAEVLDEGIYAFTFSATDGGVTGLESRPYLVTIDLGDPELRLYAPASTYDLTPEVMVVATDFWELPPTGTATLDVDLNNDNDFGDTDEMDYAEGTLTTGLGIFEIAPALVVGTYKVRARFSDLAGNEGTSNTVTLVVASSGSSFTTTDTTQQVDPLGGDALLQRGNLTFAHWLDWDRSPGTDVGLNPMLVFNSERVDVRPFIQASVQTDNGQALPSTITAQLTFDGNTQSPQVYSTSGRTQGEFLTLSQRVDSPVLATGYYSYLMTITLDYGSPITRTVSGGVYVVAEDDSPYGAGWTFAGVDRLHSVSGGVLREYGSGGHSFYADLGGGAYDEPAGDNGTLSSATGGGITTYTYETPDGQSWTFDDDGLMVKWTSADTKAVVTLTYNTGKLETVATPDEALTTLSYTSYLDTIQTGSRTVTLTHTGDDLTTIANPDGGLHTLTYDGDHKLTREDFATLRTTFAYDSGVLSGYRLGDDNPTGVTPATLFGLTALAAAVRPGVTDGLARTTRYELDGAGRVMKEIAPDGGMTRYTRDGDGWMTAMDDALDQHTTFTLDSEGYVELVEFADGTSVEYGYQPSFHALTFYGDENGNEWDYGFDGGGHINSILDPELNLTLYGYNATTGLLETSEDALGRVATFLYDTARRLETTINPAGDRATLTYDGNGNVRTSSDEWGRVTTYTNDALGRVLEVEYPTNQRVTYTYDGAGQLASMVDAATGTVMYEYDRAGRRTRAVEGVGTDKQRSTMSAYDGAGQQEKTWDENGILTQALHDAVGRFLGTIDALGNSTRAFFDLLGQQIGQSDALGNVSRDAYDERGRVVESRDALGNVTTTVYDDAGRVEETINALGVSTTFAYDGLGRQISMTEAVGTAVERTTATVYDEVGNVFHKVDALGRVTSYAYDSLNRVTAIVEALGTASERTMTYAYDKVGNQIGETDWRGVRTEREYDSLNRMTTMTEAVGEAEERVTTYAYDGAGRMVDQTDAEGYRTTFAYDALGQQISRTEGIGGSQTRTIRSLLDATGAVIGSIDGEGNVWQTTRDVLGRSSYSIDPLGNRTRTLYDGASAATGSVDARGNRTSYQTDRLGRMNRVTDALGNSVETSFDELGRVRTTTDALGRVTTFAYDELNRQISVENALGKLVETECDLNDNVLRSIDQLGKVTTFTYDELNRRESTQNPGGGIYTSVYDDAGNVVNDINAMGKVTTHIYDALNHKVETQDAIGGVATFAYDKLDRMIGLTDPEGNTSQWAFNALGFMVKATDPLGDVTTHVYDTNGRETQQIDREDQIRAFDYDKAGRKILEVWKNDSNATVNLLTFTYDQSGNQTTASDYLGTYTLTYDRLNRVEMVDGLFGAQFLFAYDEVGNRVRVEDSFGGVTTSAYDALNRLEHREFDDGVTTLSYDLAYSDRNQVTTLTRYSDLDGINRIGYSQSEYDDAGRLEKLKHRDDSNALLANYTYTYDLHSRVTSETLNGVTTSYGYDFTDQLTSAGTYAYDYDLNGNRDSAGYVTDPGNRMVNDGTFTYTYDQTGNVIGKSKGALAETWNFAYDNRNQLIGVEKRDAVGGTLLTQATYTYDVWGNRVEAQVWELGVGSSTERYVVDGWKMPVDGWNNPYSLVGQENFDVPLTLDGTNALLMRRVFGDGVDQVVARIDGGGDTGWYLPDYQGSIQNIVDEAGTLINTITYGGFGEITYESNPSDPDDRKYAARPWDNEATLYNARFASVNPVTNQRLNEDPLWRNSGWNTHGWVGNNPTNATDPSGLEFLTGYSGPRSEFTGRNWNMLYATSDKDAVFGVGNFVKVDGREVYEIINVNKFGPGAVYDIRRSTNSLSYAIEKQFGLRTAAGAALVLGALIPVEKRFGGDGNLWSWLITRYTPEKRLSFRIPTLGKVFVMGAEKVFGPGVSRLLPTSVSKLSANVLGRAISRNLPYIGWILLLYDAGMVLYHYNTHKAMIKQALPIETNPNQHPKVLT